MTILLIIVLLLTVLSLFFIVFIKNSKEPDEDNRSSPSSSSNPFYDLRNLAFKTYRDQETGNGILPVYGIIMDLNLGDGILTLTSDHSGNASLFYSSGGGGIIGGHQHKTLKEEVESYLDFANRFWKSAKSVENADLPEPDSVNFYFLTASGKFLKTEKLDNLENNSSELCELYERAHRVIGALRSVAEGQDQK